MVKCPKIIHLWTYVVAGVVLYEFYESGITGT